jgi:hypothetical protein
MDNQNVLESLKAAVNELFPAGSVRDKWIQWVTEVAVVARRSEPADPP